MSRLPKQQPQLNDLQPISQHSYQLRFCLFGILNKQKPAWKP